MSFSSKSPASQVVETPPPSAPVTPTYVEKGNTTNLSTGKESQVNNLKKLQIPLIQTGTTSLNVPTTTK